MKMCKSEKHFLLWMVSEKAHLDEKWKVKITGLRAYKIGLFKAFKIRRLLFVFLYTETFEVSQFRSPFFEAEASNFTIFNFEESTRCHGIDICFV